MPRVRKAKLIVSNPNGTPAGVPILSYTDPPQHFYEGDEFAPRAATTDEIIERRIAQGFLRWENDG